MAEKSLKVLYYGTVLGVVLGVAGVLWIVLLVLLSDDSVLQKNTILSRIEEETAVYYSDGKRQVGSIFNQQHRRYVPIRDVPAHVQNAIVAAEDKNFYQHFGVDPTAILAALWEGVSSGLRFRRGGSTITQQTVKNIMGDWEASFVRKFREMIKAFQLERVYDKQQILEFYLNQFHVSGNGNGIGIAARYYFNKAVPDLTLLEAAFIAGSVKSPSKYNPFIKKTRQAYTRAIEEGFQRKNYVLKRMYEQNWISQEEYELAKDEPVRFEKGNFTSSDVTILRLVEEQLTQKEVMDAVGISHPSQLKTAGLRVFTTLDYGLQKSAQKVTRRNLAKLETILSGHAQEDPTLFRPLKRVQEGDFVFGKITAVEGTDTQEYRLQVDLGLPSATVPPMALTRYSKLLDLPEGHAGGYRHHLRQVMDSYQVGDVVFLEIREYDEAEHHAVGELYRSPTISGGVIVLDQGAVRAVISGFNTLGFNRAIQAKRQPGSVFKMPTLLAALQLGWTILDGLDNIRQVFSYQGHRYYPRPDHLIRFKNPSIIWSGIMSENLAFIDLAYHLLDKLTMPQFKQLLAYLDLAPRDGESSAAYHYRVSRSIGVSLDRRGLEKSQLIAGIADLEPDLIFRNDLTLLAVLKSLWWGDGYVSEIQRFYREDLEDYSKKEVARRMGMVRNNYTRYRALKERFFQDWQLIEEAVQNYGSHLVATMPEYKDILSRFAMTENSEQRQIFYNMVFEEEEYLEEENALYLDLFESSLKVEDEEELEAELERVQSYWPAAEFSTFSHVDVPHRTLTRLDIYTIWEKQDKDISHYKENVLLDGRLPVRVLEYLESVVPKKVDEIKKRSERYALNQYYHHHDFKIGLGLYYVSQIVKILGVESPVDPVLSLPLGTNVVSVAEVAKLFQSFAQGKIYRFFDQGPHNQLSFIERIEDREGRVVYRPQMQVLEVIDQKIVSQMNQVMRKVVTHGTGRRAHGELYIDLSKNQKISQSKYKIRIPAFGKTGSTNDFTTSYFAGYVPYPKEKNVPLTLDHYYTVAVYVGYDRPQKMKRGRISIYGGSGALPLWTDLFKEVLEIKDYDDYLDVFDIQMLSKKEWSADVDPALWEALRVDLPQGLVIGKESQNLGAEDRITNLAVTGEEFFNPYREKNIFAQLFVPRPFQPQTPIARIFHPLTYQILDNVVPYSPASTQITVESPRATSSSSLP